MLSQLGMLAQPVTFGITLACYFPKQVANGLKKKKKERHIVGHL